MRLKTYKDSLAYRPELPVSPISDIWLFDYANIPPPYFWTPMHLHHFHQLDVVLAGEIKITLENEPPFYGHPGDAWLIPPLMWHQVESTKGYRQGSFKFHLAPRFWQLFSTSFHRFVASQHLRKDIKNLGERCTSEALLADQQIAASITLCLIECLDQMPALIPESDQLDEFRHSLWPLLERIQSEPHAIWSVSDMADYCHLSANYFSRCFKQVMGQPPQRYILETRMRTCANDLLTVPIQPIKNIAEKAGYANVHAFSRAFTQVFKISPGAYRRQPWRKED